MPPAGGPTRLGRQGPDPIESGCGVEAEGPDYLLPPLSFGGASLAGPSLRFTPSSSNVQFSCIRFRQVSMQLSHSVVRRCGPWGSPGCRMGCPWPPWYDVCARAYPSLCESPAKEVDRQPPLRANSRKPVPSFRLGVTMRTTARSGLDKSVRDRRRPRALADAVRRSRHRDKFIRCYRVGELRHPEITGRRADFDPGICHALMPSERCSSCRCTRGQEIDVYDPCGNQ